MSPERLVKDRSERSETKELSIKLASLHRTPYLSLDGIASAKTRCAKPLVDRSPSAFPPKAPPPSIFQTLGSLVVMEINARSLKRGIEHLVALNQFQRQTKNPGNGTTYQGAPPQCVPLS